MEGRKEDSKEHKIKIRIKFNAPVTLGFACICLVALLLGYMTDMRSTGLLFMTYRAPLVSPLTYLRLFTHVLGHVDFNHYIGNMSYILLLGPLLEEKYGAREIIEITLITAGVTGLISFIFMPDTGLCGASGVVFAYILLASFSSFKSGEIPVTFILVAVIYLGNQIYQGIFVDDNISQMAHIVGGIVGGISGFALNKPKDTRAE